MIWPIGPTDYEAAKQQVLVLVPMVAFGAVMLVGWSWALRNCKKQVKP